MRDLVLLLGGVRSGKTSAAVARARAAGAPVTVLVTSAPADPETRARVRRHRAERPVGWHIVECHEDPGSALHAVPGGNVVILDCVTVWIANLLLAREREPAVDLEAEVRRQLDGLLGSCATGDRELIAISNEVGMGVVPPSPLGRTYRDLLGVANQRLAAAARDVYLLVAGIPVPIGRYRTPVAMRAPGRALTVRRCLRLQFCAVPSIRGVA